MLNVAPVRKSVPPDGALYHWIFVPAGDVADKVADWPEQIVSVSAASTGEDLYRCA